MATYTKNLNLLKPAENEKYDVNLRNEKRYDSEVSR